MWIQAIPIKYNVMEDEIITIEPFNTFGAEGHIYASVN